MSKKKVEVFRYGCNVEGFEDAWIEFDTSAWGLGEILNIYTTGRLNLLMEYVPPYATGWHLKGKAGTAIPMPKSKIWDESWIEALALLGTNGRKLWAWFGEAVIAAMGEVINPPKSGDAASA